MRILTRYILREHAGPFLLSLAVLTFLFLMQYLIEILDMIIGKHLPPLVVIELFGLGLAPILALTVPMAVLTAVLLAFGRLSRDGEITALRASGVGVLRILVPLLFTGALLSIGLLWFNNRILPEANYRTSALMMDIQMMRPSFALREDVFVEEIPGYTLYLEEIEPTTSRVEGVTIVQYQNVNPPDPPSIIRAAWGLMSFDEFGEILFLDLRDGTIAEIRGGESRVQSFQRFRTQLALRGARLQRTEGGYRGDRAMPIADMRAMAARYDSAGAVYDAGVFDLVRPYLDRVVRGVSVDLPGRGRGLWPPGRVVAAHRAAVTGLERMERNRSINLRRGNGYRVEIQKKYAISFACIVFVLIGLPLGIRVRRGGTVLGFGIALGFFLLYWICLILGEDLANRRLVAAWIPMWLPNLLVGTTGIVLLVRSVHEQRFIQWEKWVRLVPGGLGRRLITWAASEDTR